jgi:hypothetical protein
MKTSELKERALDWAVAKAISEYKPIAVPAFSTDWSQGGPIIDRHGICLSSDDVFAGEGWVAHMPESDVDVKGDTALIAAMRCLVTMVLGEVVNVPEELT